MHILRWSLERSVKRTWTGSAFSTNESAWSVMDVGSQSRVQSGPKINSQFSTKYIHTCTGWNKAHLPGDPPNRFRSSFIQISTTFQEIQKSLGLWINWHKAWVSYLGWKSQHSPSFPQSINTEMKKNQEFQPLWSSFRRTFNKVDGS
jgi:hypothetical protein